MLKKCWLSYFLKLLSIAYMRAEEMVYMYTHTHSGQHLKILLIFGLVKNITFATSASEKTAMNSPLTSADLQREAINLVTVTPPYTEQMFQCQQSHT